MAGIIQTLILSQPSTRPPTFRYRRPNFAVLRCPYLTSSSISCSIPVPLRIRACEHSSSDQVDNDKSEAPKISGWTTPFLKFAADNFLPLGLANPSLGHLADRYYLSKFSTFAVFVISGLTLRNGEIGAAIDAWPVGVFGLDSFADSAPASRIRNRTSHILLHANYIVQWVALTQLAGGNSALALAMTMISNLLGILIVPFSISRFIGAGVGVSVPTKELFRSLVLTHLIPLILGKFLYSILMLNCISGLADFVDRKRRIFPRISAIFLSLVLYGYGEVKESTFKVPWIQVSRSSSLLLTVKLTVFLVAIGMGVLLHMVLLAFNVLFIRIISAIPSGKQTVLAKEENVNAFVLVASQKTLPVLVAVVEQLGGAFGESGLLVLPCVAAHLNQIIMDSFLVNFWLRKHHTSKNAKTA